MAFRRFFSLFIYSFFFCLSIMAQKIEVTAHVVDATTNEALPYVNVYVSPGIGTITNADGNFTISMDEDESVRFTFVGYESLTLSRNAIGNTVRLKPLSLALGEVTVLAQENIIVAAAKLLEKEYSKHKKERSTYFYRMNTTYRNELMEAFVEASSAGNLRDLLFLKGRRGQATLYGLDETAIGNMNLHHMMEVSPRTADSKFWARLLTPFILPNVYNGLYKTVDVNSLNHYYDMESEKLKDEDGNQTYKITFSQKKENPLNIQTQKHKTTLADLLGIKKKRAILTGTLYIDAKTKHVLRFDGQVENLTLDVIKDFYVDSTPVISKVKINFTHKRGYTEIESIANSMTNESVTVNSLLYNVDDLNIDANDNSNKKTAKKKKEIKKQEKSDNVLASIDDAGFDALLWERSNIVQRTADEARIAGFAEQMAMNDSISKVNSSMEMLVDHLTRFGKNIPQEKVYLHMDNTCYFVGDTIWFAAYTRQTNDNMPSNISGVLYVELYNQDGYLVERKLLEMSNGRSYANFVIDKQSYAGYYELRAYTRWQLNWGLYEHFHSKESEKWFLTKDLMQNYLRDYHKIYSRVFPVYDAPKEEGNYAKMMSLRPMRRIFTHDPDKHKMVLSLFPEGGNLVEGLPCRVAYEAAWDTGQALEGKLGETKSEKRGRGTFEIVPEKKFEREVIFTAKDGTVVKAKLPKAEKTGASLRVTEDYDSVYINIRTTADLADEPKGLTVMHEGVLEKFEPIIGDSLRLAIALTDLKEGVNQATVFDVHGHVWADRLFFVRNNETGKPNVSISGVKDSYEPYELINLSINAPKGRGIMSMSVRDASHRDNLYDNATMLSEMLLSSEIKGFVEDPEWFFEANDNEHNRALDLLMMTQGWRRFDWQEMAVRGAWEMTQVAEKTPVIEGQVYDIEEGEYCRDLSREFKIAEERTKRFFDDDKMRERISGFLQTNAKDFDEYDANKDLLPSTEDIDVNDTYMGYSFIDTKTNKSIFGIDRFETDYEGRSNSNYTRNFGQNHWQGNVDGIVYGFSNNTSNLAEVRYFPGQKNKAFKNKGILVHANVETLDTKQHASKDMPTEDGHFKFQLPRVYGDYILNISAADTLKKHKPDVWIQMMKEKDIQGFIENKWPYYNFSIRVNWPYPRFVKPYNYYQTHINYSNDPLLRQTIQSDGSILIDNVSVWGKHNVLHSQEDSLPTIIVDAYDAYNEALDAGFLNGQQEYIVRSYVGDYGLENPYNSKGYRIQEIFGYDVVRRGIHDITTNRDSAYLYQNLKSFKPFDDEGRKVMNINEYELQKWYDLSNIDKYILYTDYQPRLSGSSRYWGSNLPNTRIATYVFPDDSRRRFYKNRHYVVPGFSYVHTFYNPDYSQRKLDEKPKDYRRTLYWNPFLVLDKNGHADVKFWNNGSQHKISVDAQGTSTDGTMIVGKGL
ncbi:MAG: carboxypeptidase-like regulatory domain-containing protein [Prevotellaceae bacterium]|nr:carboxypeptidase-like regulatory domain-containing protein [Candidatus Minthosoma equi]